MTLSTLSYRLINLISDCIAIYALADAESHLFINVRMIALQSMETCKDYSSSILFDLIQCIMYLTKNLRDFRSKPALSHNNNYLNDLIHMIRLVISIVILHDQHIANISFNKPARSLHQYS